MDSKRTKKRVWTLEEKQHLLSLIQSKKDILLSRGGGTTNVDKQLAWKEIFDEMRARFGGRFSDSDVTKVKQKWKSIKDRAVLELNECRKNGSSAVLSEQSMMICRMLEPEPDVNQNVENNLDPNLFVSVSIKKEPVFENNVIEITDEREIPIDVPNSIDVGIDAPPDSERMRNDIQLDILMKEMLTAKAVLETAEIKKMIAIQTLKSMTAQPLDYSKSSRTADQIPSQSCTSSDELSHRRKTEELKELLRSEVTFHEDQVKRHQEAIDRIKKNIQDMEDIH